MKKYLVLRIAKYSTPTVIFSTDLKDDAVAYSEIMHRSDDGEYKIAELI